MRLERGWSAQPSSSSPESGPSRRLDRRDTPGSSSSRCVGRSPARLRSSCSRAIGRQCESTRSAGVGGRDRVLVELQVLRPQPDAGVASERRVVGGDAHLGVVEERMGVDVGRADDQPAVVDDRDLGVDVERVGAIPRWRKRAGRRGEYPLAAVIGIEQHADLPARVLSAVVGLRGQDDHDPELGRRRVAQFVGDHRHKLRGPEELIFDVDQLLRGAERAHVALEDPKFTCGDRVVHVLLDRAQDLHGRGARRGRRHQLRKQLAGQLVPANAEVLADVGDGRSAQTRRDVVPADPPSRLMLLGVVTVAGRVGEVNPADERELAVDHDRLLVMAVKWVLARVTVGLDPRHPGQVFERLGDL